MRPSAMNLAFAASLVEHVVAGVALSGVVPPAPVAVDFSIPSEISFGVIDGMEIPADQAPEAVPEPEPEPAPEPEPEPVVETDPLEDGASDEEGPGDEDAGVPVPDAGVPPDDAGVDLDAGVPLDAGDLDGGTGDGGDAVDAGDGGASDGGIPDAGDAGETDGGAAGDGDGEPIAEGEGEGESPVADATPSPEVAAERRRVEGPSTVPPGAHIAMRIDLALVGRSRLAPALRDFFDYIPDWYVLLEGSGIDPMRDLDRVFVATPDPRRRSLVILAGRVQHDEAYMRAAAERMARSRGHDPEWTTISGVPTTPWYAHDNAPRILAIVGPRHFVVCRQRDLPRVLALARQRAARARREGLRGAVGPDALLSMGQGEGFAVEVENLRAYARGDAPIPSGARVAVREVPGEGLRLVGRAQFDDAEQAAAARTFWMGQRDAYAAAATLGALSNPRLRAVPGILQSIEAEADDDAVWLNAEVSYASTRAGLGLIGREIARATRWRPRPREDGSADPVGPSDADEGEGEGASAMTPEGEAIDGPEGDAPPASATMAPAGTPSVGSAPTRFGTMSAFSPPSMFGR